MKLGSSDPRSRVNVGSTERAVSPVIGVILMVAITVILAAVIGVFVLGLGDELGDTSPTTTLDLIDGDDDADFYIDHTGGDTLVAEELAIVVNGSTVDTANIMEEEISSGETVGVDNIVNEVAEIGDEDPADVTVRHDPSGTTIESANITLVDSST